MQRLSAILGLGLLLATSVCSGGHPPKGLFYPNDEYLYEFANAERFSANPRISGDVYYNYPHAKPSPIVTYRFGAPAGRYAWGHFGAKPQRQPVYHQSANEHYKQTTVRRGP